jgi:transcriptional regulator with XRE-family HTH domain
MNHKRMSTGATANADHVGMGLLDVGAVKRLRIKRGLTQQQAADLASLPGGRDSWADVETGRRDNVTLATLERIASALGVDARELLKSPRRR